MANQHAVLSPSGAERWMSCSGAPAMEKGLVDEGSKYAAEGTCAHAVAALCITANTSAADYVGQAFDGYTFREDMVEPVQLYVDVVRQYADGASAVLVEQRVSIEPLTGEKDAAGTADVVIIRPDELAVVDLKFGMGVRVSAERNKQLMIYALGVREELSFTHGPFKRIRLVIHQPRISEAPSEWDCTSEELDAFAEEVKLAAGMALAIYATPGTPAGRLLKPSEDACRWCKAKPTCPALAKFVTDAAGADFDDIVASPVAPTDAAYQSHRGDPDQLSRKMAAIPLIEDWCKAVRAKVESELFAGVAIPGWKIVQGKRGNRQWSSDEEAAALLKKMRLPIAERYDMKLKSPPAIEKVLKEEPKRWKRVIPLITQRDGKPSVAPESDPRAAWTPPDTSDDFEPVEEESFT